MSSIRLPSWPSLAPSPPGVSPQKRVAVPADFYRFLQRGWTAHCAAQRAKQARSKSAAPGGGSGAAAGGGGSGVWEASGEGEGVEVICLDSPTAVGAGQAAAAAAEVKEEGGEAEAKRPRRRGRAAAAQQTGSDQQQQTKQEPKEEPDVVMLDADSSDEPLDVTGGVVKRWWEGSSGGMCAKNGRCINGVGSGVNCMSTQACAMVDSCQSERLLPPSLGSCSSLCPCRSHCPRRVGRRSGRRGRRCPASC